MNFYKIRFFVIVALCLLQFSACSDVKVKKKSLSIGNINMENSLFLFIGTYTSGGSDGIYVYRFDTVNGSSDYLSQSTSIENPSYLTISQNGNRVYSVTENSDTNACANAFSFDRKTAMLSLENSTKTHGKNPCYIALDPSEKFVLTANSRSGTISVIKLQKDSTLSDDRDVINFRQGILQPFQRRSHLQAVEFSPDKNLLLATDSGKDRLYCFAINKQADKARDFLSTSNLNVVEMKMGYGPKHLTFHPNGKLLYLLNEFSGKVNVFNYVNGKIKEVQTVTADGFRGKGSTDIHISPNGRFLYTSHQLKKDGIAIFSVSRIDGKLTKIGYQQTGISPQNFIITPNGKMLLVANRDSNVIQVFTINKYTGMLSNINKDIKIDKPACLKFASVEG